MDYVDYEYDEEYVDLFHVQAKGRIRKTQTIMKLSMTVDFHLLRRDSMDKK